MIDLHNHLLPALDDGPTTMDGALEMARVAVDAGITRMVCTPHVLPEAVLTPTQIGQAVAEMRDALAGADIPLQIDAGAEIGLDVAFDLDDATLAAYSLAGNGVWVLLELPFEGWPLHLPQFLTDLEMRGFRAVLAHPERARSIQVNVGRLRDLVGRGALVQVTAGAVVGEFGALTQQVAHTLFGNGLVHFVSSDAHSATRRAPGLRPALEAYAHGAGVDASTLEWMVTDGPAAVLAGGGVRPPKLGTPPQPPRPAPPPKRRGGPRTGGPGRGGPRRHTSR